MRGRSPRSENESESARVDFMMRNDCDAVLSYRSDQDVSSTNRLYILPSRQMRGSMLSSVPSLLFSSYHPASLREGKSDRADQPRSHNADAIAELVSMRGTLLRF